MERLDPEQHDDSADFEIPEDPEVTLVIQNHRFQCKRKMLAEHSLYFAAMFKSGMIESNSEVVELKGVCPRAMEDIIHYLKTNEIPSHMERFPDLVEAAIMYQFEALGNRCIKTVRNNMNLSNCLGIMFLACKFDLEDLYREAIHISLWDFEAVLLEPEFLSLAAEQVIEYLSHDGLRTSSEDIVFNGVLDWIKHDEKKRVPHYEDLFSAVRFSSISLKSLKNMAHHPFVRHYRQIKLLVHEIWKIQFAKYVHLSGSSPLSVSPLSSISPGEDLSPEGSETIPRPAETPPLELNISAEQVMAHRLLYAGPRSIPMVPALVLWNTTDKSKPPILIYLDVGKQKLVKIGRLTKAFHSCGKMVSTANGFKACAVGNCVYVIGGEFMLGHGNWNNCVWKYNTFNKSWSFVANLQNPRRHHELCIVEGNIYLIGGIGRFRVAQDTVQRLDLSSGNLSDINPMPVPITSAAVTAYQGKVYIFESVIYRYNANTNSWSSLKSVSLPNHGFHSALPHANGIYLLGRLTKNLSLYCPDCFSEPFHKATFSIVGQFRNLTENACIVGNKIYSFCKTKFLVIESYDIETNKFNIEYASLDETFLGPQYQHGCFAIPRYS